MDIFENKIFKIEKEHLCFDGRDLIKLVEKYGSPLYVFSERELRKNVNEVIVAFRTFYDKTSIHYAAQCESTLANLQVIRDAGCNLQVNSGGELFKGLQAGFEGDQIIFTGACKTGEEIELAIKSGVKSVNIDSIYELTRIAKIAEALDTPVNIALMVAPEISYYHSDRHRLSGQESEFGITFEQLRTAIRMSQKNKKYVKLKGYHFHLQNGSHEPESVHEAFVTMLETAVKMYQLTGFSPQSLNIGGGISSDNMGQIAEAVSEELNAATVEKWAGKEYGQFFKDIELIIEPGRKIAASAGILLTSIVNEKYRKNLNENWLVLDEGLNNGMEFERLLSYNQLLCANKITENHNMSYKISGLSYASSEGIRLPGSITAGDFIAFINAGAYSHSYLSSFSGRPRPGAIMIKKNGTVKQIKRPQRYEDLLEGEEPFREELNVCAI
ncbi:diaminopimelate decarboxylase family protein [Aminipila luticellarii]|uniref:Orn/DAP/Arg decarboxylase 2 N-terminal domain-containing protein n=1 Tax=Aminipila luticellarii TaxID=2507160 RepID=A0A410PU95_9FIRM|nr:hypothetical protein [Aminipila luticellarii]QAT42495.1 hypothetical protein EQM06_04195 [Aminipila luticellarii]